MHCSNCKKEILEGQNFCPYCGTKVINTTDTSDNKNKLNEIDLTNKIIENKDNIENAVNFVMKSKNLNQPSARQYVDKVLKDNGIKTNNNIGTNNNFQTNQANTIPLVNKIILFIIMVLLLWGGYKFFQPIFFPTNLQKNGQSAEFYAQMYLEDYCKANELEVKAIEEKNGIYIVECKTTNSTLKSLYGSTFYYGYMPSASGLKYTQYVNESKQKVYDSLNE